MVRIKICCISTIAEANLAVNNGAAALGLVGPMPSGPGIIDDQTIRQIVISVPPPISTFLLSSSTNARDIIAQYRRTYTSAIQIVDDLPTDEYEKLRSALPHVKIVQVLHVLHHGDISKAVKIAKFVDVLLLDSGNPGLKVLGGTGKTHNWDISREIVEAVDVPVFLAGGIRPENIRRAIEHVKPFGIDLCTGVRTEGKLDEAKLKALFAALKLA